MTINEYFDQVYLLNLDSRPEKLEKVEKRLKAVGIEYKRWPAIDGKTLTKEYEEYQSFPLNTYEKLILGRKAMVSLGAMGCLFSYIEIVKDAKDNGYKRVLCLEDDVLFHKEFNDRWERLSQEVPEDWKLLYLGASQHNWTQVSSFNDNLYYAQLTDSTFAFGIDHSVFDKFLQHAECKELPVDTYLSTVIQRRYPKNCFVFSENLIIAELGNSDIRTEKSNTDLLQWDLSKYDMRSGVTELVMGVTTYNRPGYLKKFVRTFDVSKNDNYHWTLIIADDRSDGETAEYLSLLEDVREKGYELIVIRNNRKGIAWQTNTILKQLSEMRFDFAFIANDDIFFQVPGWDEAYMDAAFESGYYHLVYHNTQWKPRKHTYCDNDGSITSHVPAIDCLGCFFTVTPEVLRKVGYFDYKTFGFRGGAHIDYTFRCCRAGFNKEETLWDLTGSMNYIEMHQREGYIPTFTDKELKPYQQKHVLQRKERAIKNEKRIYVAFNNSIEKAKAVSSERGIVIMAIGDPMYGRLAFNLALSIKMTDKHMPVALFYSEKSLEDLGDHQLAYFDHIEEVEGKRYIFQRDVHELDSCPEDAITKQYQAVKTQVYELSPYNVTIYLDADTLWNPFRQPQWLFDSLSNEVFTICTNGFLNMRTEKRTRDNYLFWVKNDNWGALKRYYKKEDGVLPQCSSTFFHFRRCKENDKLFLRVYQEYVQATLDFMSPASRWASGIADEYAFNVAMWLENRLPHTIPYHPIYFRPRSGEMSQKDIMMRFWGMTNGGVQVLPEIAQIYNKGVDYFTDMAGIDEKYYHEDKTGKVPGRLLT